MLRMKQETSIRKVDSDDEIETDDAPVVKLLQFLWRELINILNEAKKPGGGRGENNKNAYETNDWRE